MTAINGKTLSGAPEPPDPRQVIAEAVYTAMMDEGDPLFSEMDEEERADVLYLTEQYLTAHINFLHAHGLKIVPAGAVPVPKSEMEALAMVQAAQTFLDSRKRKSRLVGVSPGKPKLILPKGSH